MSRSIRRRVAVWLGLAGLSVSAVCFGITGLSWTTTATAAESGAIGVITHPDRRGVPVTRALLRDLFTMRTRQWADGRPVTVFVLSDTSEAHQRFCRELLDTYPYVLRSRWDRLVFTGAGFAPETVRSVREMRERVASTPGAIGYIDGGGIDATDAGRVRVVPVRETP